MMIGCLDLKGLARAKFKSTKELAEKVGWSPGKTYRIVSGRQSPDVNEVRALSEALGLQSAEEIMQVFSIYKCPQNETEKGDRTT